MMVSFSKLPYHIKENIFSRIRIRDLYEVSAVSEEWWWLAIKTYKGILSEDDLLIKTLLLVYNGQKKLSTQLMWFQLVKYASVYGIEFNHIPHPAVLEIFLESRRQIRCLCLRTGYPASISGSHKTELKSILNFFPHLKQLKLQNFVLDPNSLKIPKGIKQMHLSGNKFNGVAWSTLFEDPESIQSLKLDVHGLSYDHCVFKNLKSLSLHFRMPLIQSEMKSILDLIRGHQFLKSVKLVRATITKEWFNVFGQTIENISLEDIYIENGLLTELGNDGCYERRVMSFVCCDLRTVKRFLVAKMNKKFDEVLAEEEQDTNIDYSASYTCKPQLMEEELFLDLDSRLSRQMQTITTTDAGPALRALRIEGSNFKEELLTNCVPASVKKFHLNLEGDFENLSINHLCERPQNLEELEVVAFKTTFFDEYPKFFSLPKSFATLTNLKILYLVDVNPEGVQDLLQQCVSLEKLTLITPHDGCFSDLSPAFVSKTIREVNLHWSYAHLEDVLYHCPNLEVLVLYSHLTLPLEIPTAIAKLKFFSAMFHGFSDFRSNLMRLALLMDTVDVPCKLFFSHLDKSWSTFKMGYNDSIIEDFYEDVYRNHEYVYCCGIPTRFLALRGFKILRDLQHFIEIWRGKP